MPPILHQHRIEWVYPPESLPTAYAHVLEHMLCRLLVARYQAIRVTGKTTQKHIRLEWVGPDVLSGNMLVQQLMVHADPDILLQELRAISVELGWLSELFQQPDPLQTRLENLLPLLSVFKLASEVVKCIRITDELWLGLSEKYVRFAKEISQFQIEKGQRYPQPTTLQNTQGLILCQPLAHFEGLTQLVIYPIHHWYWVLNALGQYSSSVSQHLRKSVEDFYSYGFGVFPYCGTWYLYLTGLHETTLNNFLTHFINELDVLLNSPIELEKLHREVEADIVVELNALLSEPKRLSRMLMNSTLDFKNFKSPPQSLVPTFTSRQFFTSQSLSRLLHDIRYETAHALEEANHV